MKTGETAALHVGAVTVGAGWRVRVALVAVLLGALIGAVLVSRLVFEGIPHTEDELAFVFQARTLAEGRLWASIPPHPEAFYAPFLIQFDGKWFGKYPPGYPITLALAVLAGVPWLLNPLLGAATLLLVYLLGKELYGPGTGLLAAFLGAASPFFLLQAGSLLSHVHTLFFLTLFMLLFLKVSRHPVPGPAPIGLSLGAGASLGMAFLARPLTAIGVSAPFVGWAMVLVVRHRGRGLWRYALIVLGFAPVGGFLLLYNYLLTSNPFLNPQEMYWPFDRIGMGPGLGTRGYHDFSLARLNLGVNARLLFEDTFGWPGAISLAFIPVPFLFISRRAWDYLLLAAFGCLIGAYMFYWSPGPMYGPRYYFEAMPAILLLTARGILELARGFGWVGKRLAGARAGAYVTIPVWLLLAGLTGYGLGVYAPGHISGYYDWYGISAENLAIVRKANPGRSLIFVVPEGSWTTYGSVFPANSPNLDSEVVYALDQGDAKNTLVAKGFPGRKLFRLKPGRLEPYKPSVSESSISSSVSSSSPSASSAPLPLGSYHS